MIQVTALRPICLGYLIVLMIAASRCVAVAADATPGDAVQKAKQMMADGQQAQAVQFIDQQLIQRRLEPSADERYQLLMLKAEALMQTNKSSMAANAFEQARRAAPNGKAAAIARADILLIRAAPLNKYTPKRTGSDAIDIVNPDSRRAAFDALRADMAASAKPKIERATQGKTLVPALDLLPAVFDIASVEFASTGSTEETKADVASLGEHARDLMKTAIADSQRHITSLGDLALSIDNGERRGLQSNEMKELTPIITELRRIEKTARDVRRRSQELGNPATAWEEIATDAADVAESAERVMEFGAPSTRG